MWTSAEFNVVAAWMEGEGGGGGGGGGGGRVRGVPRPKTKTQGWRKRRRSVALSTHLFAVARVDVVHELAQRSLERRDVVERAVEQRSGEVRLVRAERINVHREPLRAAADHLLNVALHCWALLKKLCELATATVELLRLVRPEGVHRGRQVSSHYGAVETTARRLKRKVALFKIFQVKKMKNVKVKTRLVATPLSAH